MYGSKDLTITNQPTKLICMDFIDIFSDYFSDVFKLQPYFLPIPPQDAKFVA